MRSLTIVVTAFAVTRALKPVEFAKD